LKACGDLANAAKHFTLDKRVPITRSASSKRGFGLGRYGVGAFGIGEESIEVQLNDGTNVSALELTQQVLDTWQAFFSRHRI
jgi:hypothetical protein